MSRELELDHFVMKTLFKVMTKNKSYDERYLSEAKDCCHSILKSLKDFDSTALHEDLVEVPCGIFSILNTNSISTTLATAASKFNVSE